VAAKDAAIVRALEAPSATIRCYLLYGPDEAGSRALAARLAKALGPDAERIDLSPAQLKADPALLSDEAASVSLFGGARHIRVEGVGEESLAAIEALLEAPAAGNPVVLIAGTLKKDAKLLKRLDGEAAAMTFASWPPEGADADRLAIGIAHDLGLRIDADLARRLGDSSGGDRAVLTREIEKLALYADAAPDAPHEASHAMLDAIGADSGEADTGKFSEAVTGGDLAVVDKELARLAAEGQEGIPLVRALLRRFIMLASARAEVDRGISPDAAINRVAGYLPRNAKARLAADLSRWPSVRIALAIDRLAGIERQLKSSGGPGPIAAEAVFFAIARAQRRR
jgi:DNA polymerase III subunit delta